MYICSLVQITVFIILSQIPNCTSTTAPLSFLTASLIKTSEITSTAETVSVTKYKSPAIVSDLATTATLSTTASAIGTTEAIAATTTTLYSVPEMPVCLNVTSLSSNISRIFWQINETDGATHFHISYNGSDNYVNVSKDIACPRNSTMCDFIISDWRPGNAHTIQIYGSARGIQSKTCWIQIVSKPEPPICLDKTSPKSTSVQVFWQLKNSSVVTHFQISVKNSTDPTNISKDSACSRNSNVCTHVITDLEPGNTYDVKIAASSYKIQSNECSLNVTTVPEPPTCLKMTSLNTSAVQVFWQSHKSSGASHFQISRDGNPSNVSKENACSTGSFVCSYVLTGLQPATIYFVHIFASAYGIPSDKCSLAAITVPEEPNCLNITSASPKSILVYWKIKDLGGATYFQISYNGSKTPLNVSRDGVCTTNSTLCSLKITDLEPGKNYNIRIFASAYGIQSGPCFLAGNTMPVAPDCLQLRTLSTSALQISWRTHITGGATDFQIRISDRNETISRDVVCGTSYLYHVCEYLITGLNPDTRYDVTLFAASNGVYNDNPCLLQGYTMPEPPFCLNVNSISPTVLQVVWHINYTGRAQYFLISHNGSKTYMNASRESACSSFTTCSVNISALQTGKSYSITVTALSHDIDSNQSCSLLGITLPNAPNCSHVSALNTTSLHVNWYKDPAGGESEFVMHLNGGEINYTVFSEIACHTSLCSYTISGLTPASTYDIMILSSIYGVMNNDACYLLGITLPSSPVCFNVTSLSPTVLQVYWEGQVSPIDGASYFLITHDNSSSYNNISREIACTPISNVCYHTFTDLQPGKTYDIHVFASAYGVRSYHSCSLIGTTMPNNPECSELRILSTTALQVFWRIKATEDETMFQIKVWVGKETALMKDICNGPFYSSFYFCNYNITGLHPGSQYDIEIFASSNGIRNDKSCSLRGTTSKSLPETPTCLSVTAQSPTVLQIKWQISYTGGARYFHISHNGSEHYNNISRNEACSPSTVLCSVNVTSLAPGKLYNIAVSSYSFGIKNSEPCSSLGATMPNPPNCSHVSAVNTSALQIHWNKYTSGGGTDFILQLDDCIVNYTVSNETACSSPTYCSYTINGLEPGSNHNITIFASSYGILNSEACTLFGITLPSQPNCLNATAVNTSAIQLFWQKPEGATHFQITLDSISISETLSREIVCMSSSVCTRIVNDIAPGSRHLFHIFASSYGVQNTQSCHIVGTTVPSGPIGFQTLERTPHNFTIKWEDGAGYRDFYRVSYSCQSLHEPNDSWQDYLDLHPTVKKYTSIYLEPGTRCELNVYAVVTTGVFSSPLTGIVSTTESAPGPVSFFNISEAASTHLKINWLPPSRQNGIIRGYTLIVREKGKYCIEKPACDKHLDLSGHVGRQNLKICRDTMSWTENASCTTDIRPNCRSLLLHNLKPFVTYVIGIMAYTTCSGEQICVNVTTLSIAPPYPVRTPTQSSVHVADGTRQIAIDLPLSDFLCSTEYGSPESWGVLVSQSTKATDDPFRGNTSDFLTKLDLQYRSWRDIKDQDNFPPYRATNAAWKPTESCAKYARNRRSKGIENEPDIISYIIGQEGDCSGTGQHYCNGYLKQNTEYSFRVYVCTSGGCTESFWSPPIKTEQDSTSLIITLSVISSSLLLCCIVLVVMLRMRRMMCFKAYKIEDAGTFAYDTPFGMGGSKLKIHRPIKLSELQTHVDTMHRDSNVGFSTEYKFLKEIEPKHSTEAAESQACRSKNRYTNILPYDHSRVKLLPVEDEEGSDYINANYIQGYNSKREYIAAQGPLPATRDDFWRMVWEQSAEIIVMLTKCTEKGRVKCDKYWPDVNEPVFHGELIVNVSSESTLGDYVIRVIHLKLSQLSKKVYHFSFLNWPDMGCPKDPGALLNFVTSVRTYVKPNFQSPIIVHCSAGVGRTGTFIAIDHLMQQVRDYDEVDIFNLVYEMRNQRCNMVQTEDQYVYIHDSILEYITEDDDNDEEGFYATKDTCDNNIYENEAYMQE